MSETTVFDLNYSLLLCQNLGLKTLDTIPLMWYYRYEFEYHTIEQ